MTELLRVFVVPDRAVVTGEHDQHVVGDSGRLETRENLPDNSINRHHEISIHPDIALADKFLRGQPRCVRRGQGEVHEKGSTAVAAGDEAHGLVSEEVGDVADLFFIDVFTVALHGEPNRVSLQVAGGKFVSAANGGGTSITSTATSVGTHEIFDVINFGGNQVAFRTSDGQHFLRYLSSNLIDAGTKTITPEARFTLFDLADKNLLHIITNLLM